MRRVDLRKFAREWTDGCLIRIPGICSWTPTWLCHDREASTGGASLKPPDFCGCIGCDSCHGVIDRRTHINHFTLDQVREFKHHALLRTWLAYSESMVLIRMEDL